jgi:hypothetical protein
MNKTIHTFVLTLASALRAGADVIEHCLTASPSSPEAASVPAASISAEPAAPAPAKRGRPKKTVRTFAEVIDEAKSVYPDETKLTLLFAELNTIAPGHYELFGPFLKDIKQCVEEKADLPTSVTVTPSEEQEDTGTAEVITNWENLKTLCKPLIEASGPALAKLKETIKAHGGSKLADLPVENYPAFIKEVQAQLADLPKGGEEV